MKINYLTKWLGIHVLSTQLNPVRYSCVEHTFCNTHCWTLDWHWLCSFQLGRWVWVYHLPSVLLCVWKCGRPSQDLERRIWSVIVSPFAVPCRYFLLLLWYEGDSLSQRNQAFLAFSGTSYCTGFRLHYRIKAFEIIESFLNQTVIFWKIWTCRKV